MKTKRRRTRNAFVACELDISKILWIRSIAAKGIVAAAERVCSTGRIGELLPMAKVAAGITESAARLSRDAAEGVRSANAILTSDTRPKSCTARFTWEGKTVTVAGIAKGAGMIEPNLATMLVYVLTDLAVPRGELRAMLAKAIDASFNAISIDSDTSTSDTVALISSGRVPCEDFGAFERGLHTVCRDLAEDVVRNGEGVRHVIRVRVTRAASPVLARALGKAIVNAPLFKCAVAGNDPNVGRLVQAIGKHIGAFAPQTDLSKLRAAMGRLGEMRPKAESIAPWAMPKNRTT